jgi:ankyrin repeat protein
MGNSESVSFLMFTGIKCSKLDDNGLTAQHYAIQSRNPIIIEILALFGNDVNVQDTKGNTPLHHSIEIGDINMIKILLEYKADITIKNDIGFTPKDYCLLDNKLKSFII